LDGILAIEPVGKPCKVTKIEIDKLLQLVGKRPHGGNPEEVTLRIYVRPEAHVQAAGWPLALQRPRHVKDGVGGRERFREGD